MTLKRTDVVIIGAGWAGAILAKEMREAGRSVVMLERGPDRATAKEGTYPGSIDELRGAIRHRLFQNPAKTTVTIRNTINQTALPTVSLPPSFRAKGLAVRGYIGRVCIFALHQTICVCAATSPNDMEPNSFPQT